MLRLALYKEIYLFLVPPKKRKQKGGKSLFSQKKWKDFFPFLNENPLPSDLMINNWIGKLFSQTRNAFVETLKSEIKSDRKNLVPTFKAFGILRNFDG